ncbi:hypothetical protein [Parabacteroides goldsteinii]|uniref:hypothetical protein n=1 Tax=Parabacteroides goldsteinii TaxID=328812 RepID=UPI00261FF2B9|nr:hypothetical protein [Parabacteroides goldsteinii]
MEEIRNLLDEEIKAEIEALSSLSFGSKERLTATENLATLYKLRVDETKTALDFEEKSENRKNDDEFKKNQLAEQVKDRYFKLGIAAAELVLPLMFYAVWMRRGFKFEENGTYTSTTFRGLFNRFRPTKK